MRPRRVLTLVIRRVLMVIGMALLHTPYCMTCTFAERTRGDLGDDLGIAPALHDAIDGT